MITGKLSYEATQRAVDCQRTRLVNNTPSLTAHNCHGQPTTMTITGSEAEFIQLARIIYPSTRKSGAFWGPRFIHPRTRKSGAFRGPRVTGAQMFQLAPVRGPALREAQRCRAPILRDRIYSRL